MLMLALLAPATSAAQSTPSAPPFETEGPILHEYVPFDPSVDSQYGEVTTPGGFKAELVTNSGKVAAPDPGRPISEKTPTYGTKPAVPDEKFVADRDTRRVDHLPYDDPFRPKLAPFKRLVAFDKVASDYALEVSDKKHVRVSTATTPIKVKKETFYVDLALDLRAGEPVRIPTAVGGSVVTRAHMVPAFGFHLEQDGAENLFVLGDAAGKARLILEMDAPHAAFEGFSLSRTWSDADLKRMLVPLPPSAQKAAETLAKEIPVDNVTMRPHDVVVALVGYFRAFKESEDPPPNTGDVYLDIARSKKGVCRHRAFAFMVTAIGLGVPTRFVHNEAHAWIEVWDGDYWHRIDLGGAGRILDDKSEKAEKPQPQFDPGSDPYSWPAGATQGRDLVPPSSPTAPTPPPTGGPPPSPAPTHSGAVPSTAPPSKVTVTLGAGDNAAVKRKNKLSVSGKVVDGSGNPCKQVRVDIKLSKDGDASDKSIGALMTDDSGVFADDVTIPTDIAIGNYSVIAHTPGAGACGQGSSE